MSLQSIFPQAHKIKHLKVPLRNLLCALHLLFSEMSSDLVKKIVQIIKLIRSKGIGVYFISQSPSDIPEEILGQLGNKVQHVLRSYTPSDEKAIKAAANSFRSNPNFSTAEAIKSLATGEALISFLNEGGEPSIVERMFIVPPQSYCSAISDSERDNVIKSSRCYMKYVNDVNNVSAEEKVQESRTKKAEEKQAAEQAKIDAKEAERKAKEDAKLAEKKAKEEMVADKPATAKSFKDQIKEAKAEAKKENEKAPEQAKAKAKTKTKGQEI